MIRLGSATIVPSQPEREKKSVQNRNWDSRNVVAIAEPTWRRLGIYARMLVARSSPLIVFLSIWHLAALRFANPVLLPTPVRVLDEIIQLSRSGEMATHVFASLSRLLVGYFAALGSGC